MNMGMQISLQYSDFISFRYTHKSGVSGPCVSPIIYFLRNQNHTRIPFSSHPHQHLSFVFFLMMDILTGENWYHVVVLICIYIQIGDVGHLLICLFVICTFCLKSEQKNSIDVFPKRQYNIFNGLNWHDILQDCERFSKTKLWHRTRKLTTQACHS